MSQSQYNPTPGLPRVELQTSDSSSKQKLPLTLNTLIESQSSTSEPSPKKSSITGFFRKISSSSKFPNADDVSLI